MARVVKKVAGGDPRFNAFGADILGMRDMPSEPVYDWNNLFDFMAKMTALPAILTALNATYTRNSVKNVPQNGALVALAANQFGTSYDDVTGVYGFVPEPAATNLAKNSDGAASTYTVSNVADGTAVTGFTNGLAFGNNSVTRYAYKSLTLADSTAHTISVFLQMDDGGAPVVGTSNSTGDMGLVLDGVLVTTAALVRHIGAGVYRISTGWNTGSVPGSAGNGVIKYTGQSARTFRVTGIQVETGIRATSYITTTGSTASRAADVLTVPLWINNAKDSQDGSTANWTRTNCTVTTSGTAPDGTATAQLITVTSTAATTFATAAIKAPAAIVTYSVRVKQGSRTTCDLKLRNSTTATDFTAGQLTFATGAITGAGWAATDLGSGWFLCTFSQSTGITVGDSLLAYAHHTGGSHTSSGTGYFWGAQVEPGSVATAYRKTTSTLESAANANIAGFSSAAYTLAADYREDVNTAAVRTILSVDDTTTSNRALLRAETGNTIGTMMVSGGSTTNNTAESSIPLTRSKAAYSAKADSFLRAVNGVAGTSDVSGAMALSPLFLRIGNDLSSSAQWNGFLYRVQLITQALTQAQLNGLTT